MKRKSKEPVKSPLVWIVFVVVFAAINPWYFPAGSFEPLIWGVPYWAWIILAASLALSVFVTWVVCCQWDMGADDDIGDDRGQYHGQDRGQDHGEG
ncbi:hypothetical protein T35B1_03921 [Salinisphaera shabanensis T35B1]|uniref:Sodiumpantothenate symporter protein n=1 Tax=Salinisphaera shabanensis E1L3A TaxID=1033802 RepID=U2FRA9_9GAMM|nr:MULTISPECIES: hypothetical protein [Gammaproteobacteria]ERJ18609.1 sodiumpantothenate symporter protein [Salinisphaera shabanensis E1L3A]MAS08911.1 hypothetical protein [Salinisphaera sp.]MBO9471331.1 hypothetical protein [Endozoicomonas sp. G2_2]